MDFRVGRLSASQVEKTPRLPLFSFYLSLGAHLERKLGWEGGIYFIYIKM